MLTAESGTKVIEPQRRLFQNRTCIGEQLGSDGARFVWLRRRFSNTILVLGSELRNQCKRRELGDGNSVASGYEIVKENR